MSPLAVGPVIALLGIVAAYFVLRGRARSRKSMYRTLRETREQDLRRARERAAAARAAAEKAVIDKENAERTAADQATRDAATASAAAAAAAAAPSEPAATAKLPEERIPAYTEPLPDLEPIAPAAPPPVPEREPVVASAPEPEVVAEASPEPVPPTRESGGRASWEIVEPDKADAMPAGAGAALPISNRSSSEVASIRISPLGPRAIASRTARSP